MEFFDGKILYFENVCIAICSSVTFVIPHILKWSIDAYPTSMSLKDQTKKKNFNYTFKIWLIYVPLIIISYAEFLRI